MIYLLVYGIIKIVIIGKRCKCGEKMINNFLLIIFPILLFGFKNFLPIICERIFSGSDLKGVWAKTAEELIQFPVDLLFIAISYTIPKIIDTIYTLSSLKASNLIEESELVSSYSQYCKNLLNYSVRCFILLIMLPAFVLFTKLAIKLGDEKKITRQILLTIVLYALSIVAVIYSLFIYQ